MVLKVTQLSGVHHILLNRGYFYPHSSDLKCHPAALTVLGGGLIKTAKSDSTAEALIAYILNKVLGGKMNVPQSFLQYIVDVFSNIFRLLQHYGL